jgi:hypothetical protein
MNNDICFLRLACLLCIYGIVGSLASACGVTQGSTGLPGSARGAGTGTTTIKEQDMHLIAAAERGEPGGT